MPAYRLTPPASVKPERIVGGTAETYTIANSHKLVETAELAERAGAAVVRLRRRRSAASAAGTPYLAYVINKGLEALEGEDLDYVMVSGAECLYPRGYVETLVSRLEKQGVSAAL